MAASVAIGVVACQQVEVCLDQSEGEHCGDWSPPIRAHLSVLGGHEHVDEGVGAGAEVDQDVAQQEPEVV